MYIFVPSIYDASKVSPMIGLRGFKKLLATGKFPKVAVIKSFILSTGSDIAAALLT